MLLTYELPLGEIVLDFYDQLKSRTRGYASFDYDLAGLPRRRRSSRVDVLVGGEPVDALSLIVHRDAAYDRGQAARREAARGDPAADVRRPDPGGDRLARDRARDGEGEAQGRAREVLRRRHHAQAQAAREAEEGQEADEAGRRRRGAAGGVPRRAQPRRRQEEARDAPRLPTGRPRPSTPGASRGVRHLYVHLRSASHRCGYCDFVTAVGRRDEHGAYVDALLAELERERGVLARAASRRCSSAAGRRRSRSPARSRACSARCPTAGEVTVEANPETVTPELAALLRERGVTRVSLGAQIVPAAPARGARARRRPGRRPARRAYSP